MIKIAIYMALTVLTGIFLLGCGGASPQTAADFPDETLEEPSVLRTKFPSLLVNGYSGYTPLRQPELAGGVKRGNNRLMRRAGIGTDDDSQ